MKNYSKYIVKIPMILLLIIGFRLHAQTTLIKSKAFSSEVSLVVQARLLQALDTLLYHINNGKLSLSEVDSKGAELSLSIFSSIKELEISKKKDDSFYKPQLINMHAIGVNQYLISIAYIGNNTLRAIVCFEAFLNPDKITFSIPLSYITQNWRIKKVGNITYHYLDNIDLSRANKFNQNNIRIAEKIGLQPEQFDFYLVNNYHDILPLLGYMYDSETAGQETDGYGVDGGYIFSIMHNEDFSHDAFHYYAAKIRTHSRNSAAEEGIAYSWGNAYYTDEYGAMINQSQLVKLLKRYLKLHPGTNLLGLFDKNPPILPAKTKVRSLLASLISDEVERRKGIIGIKTLIDCGNGDDNYFRVINKMIGINTTNFNIEVKHLLNECR
ncbi:MAG: hypothetical protein JWR05_270 [Mucilaginibacter sp.]|nr:hypothetical protein [Mucilaginibacter sp.]